MRLEKNRTYACTFPVQRREINVVKVRFTMRYSSRKLSNDKVISTACNFWRQIACSFQVMSLNILFLGNKIFEIPPFFQTRPGDLGKKVHACSLRFSALNPGARLDLTVNFHHEHFIDPTNCPWVSEDVFWSEWFLYWDRQKKRGRVGLMGTWCTLFNLLQAQSTNTLR